MPAIAIGSEDGGADDGKGRCPECGAEVYLIAGRCPKCGRWFEADDRAAMRAGRHVRSELQTFKLAAKVLAAVLVIGLIVLAIASFAG